MANTLKQLASDAFFLTISFAPFLYFFWPFLLLFFPIIVIAQLYFCTVIWKMLECDYHAPLVEQKPWSKPSAHSSAGGPAFEQTPQDAPRLRKRLSVFEKIAVSPVNPFVSLTWKISFLERIRLTILGVTLVPLRFLFGVVFLLIAGICCNIILIGVPRKQLRSVPLSHFGAWRVYAARFVIYVCARAVCLAFGFFYISTKGTKASAHEAPVVVANHITFLEAIYLVSQYCPAPVGAIEHLSIPVLGAVIQCLQLLGVDRKDPESRRNISKAIQERSAALAASSPHSLSWPQLLIFPEGTTTNQSALVQFKPGAFSSKVPVQPVTIKFTNERFVPAWLSAGSPVLNIALRLFAEPANWMEVEFLPVYKPSTEEKENADLYARNVRALMAARLGIPTTEHSYEDVLLQTEALRSNLPPHMASIEISKIKQNLNLTLDDAKRALQKFRELDKQGRGLINVFEFEEALGLQNNPIIRHVFRLLDTDEKGEIDFRQYLIGLGLASVSKDDDISAVIKLAFHAFDLQDKGKVEVKLLRNTFRAFFRRQYPDVSEDEENAAFAVIDQHKEIDFKLFEQFCSQDIRYAQLFKQTLHLS